MIGSVGGDGGRCFFLVEVVGKSHLMRKIRSNNGGRESKL